MPEHKVTTYDLLLLEIKSAMLANDFIKRDCLRYAVSEIQNRTVNAGKPITDDVCISVLRKLVKQHDDSIEQFSLAGRTDLAAKEEVEKEHISSFLPKLMDEHETNVYIERLIADNSIEKTKKNMGVVMKMLAGNPDVDRKLAAKYLNLIMR